MFQRLNNRCAHYLILLSAGAALCLVNLGGPALWDVDEGRNATAALEMRETGDWVVPKFNGELRSHKPVLLYWLQVVAFAAFGVNEFAARLPSALSTILTSLLVYELARQMFGASTGLIAGLILSSSLLVCASAHFANPDALLLTFTTATLLVFWLGVSRGGGFCFALAGLAAGFAVLAKGPVGVVLPVGVILVYLLWSRQWNLLIRRVWIGAIGLFALVALPWYILVSVETKRAFLTEFFLRHNLDRALNPHENHAGPVWYYVAVLLVGLSPWSAFFGAAVWYSLKSVWCADGENREQMGDPTSRPAIQAMHRRDCYRFIWCWIGIYLVAFTAAATKLPNYILPVFPAFALITADYLDRWRSGQLSLPSWVQPASLATLALAGLTVLVGLLLAGGTIKVDLLRGKSWPGLAPWSALGVVLLVMAAACAWCLHLKRRSGFVVVMVLGALGFMAPLAAGGSSALNSFRAPRPLVDMTGAFQRDREIRVGCFQLEFLPSLNFYVQRNVRHHHDDNEVLDFLRQELEVYLFLPRREWDRLCPQISTPHRLLAAHPEMYRAGEVVVVTNR